MKKLASILLSFLLVCSLASSVFAADEGISVYVTVADKDSELALAREKITVTDVDGDGSLTINDALFCAHEEKYPGGAAAGYQTQNTAYGLSMTKLWGAENGTAFGYYLNDASAWSLTDTVKDGDLVSAFVYTDLTAWSDTYCYFDKGELSVKAGDSVKLKLFSLGYDANFATVTLPVAGAVITVDGKTTSYKTDSNGEVTLSFDKSGSYVISALSDTQNLVPPVCAATVSQKNPSTGDFAVYATGASLLALAATGAILKKRKKDEI